MTCHGTRGLQRTIKTKAEVAAECRAAAAEYEAMAARAVAAGHTHNAEHFTALATRRRQRATELEGGQG